jgi:hypothetical protein
LQQELNQLRAQFQTISVEHRDQEQQLRKEKYKHETNVEGLVRVYDEDMDKKQVKKNRILILMNNIYQINLRNFKGRT